MAKKWTEEEENFLFDNKDDDVKELAKGLRELGYYRSDGAIKSRLRRFRTLIIEIDEHKLHPEKEVVFETEYNQGEQYQESKKQVEEVEEAYPETDAIVLDELSDVSPITAPKEEGGKLTWLILLAAGIGLVAYGWFN